MNSILVKVGAIIGISLLLFINSGNSAEKDLTLKPFTLAKIYNNTNHIKVAEKVKIQLTAAGFKIIGTYEPYQTTKIFIITNDTLLKNAAKSKFGGFGAGIRVSVTQIKNDVQVAHNNPAYMGVAYKMNSNLGSIQQKMAKTLGYVKNFGGKGISPDKLAEYHYGVDLEGFDGFMDLAIYKSHKEALLSVEKGFERQLKNMTKVYRIDIPGQKQSIFGVSLKNNKKDQPFLNDQFVMDIIDHKDLRRSAHLPYEIMVIDKRVIMMHPHFRLAINFPDMHMYGEHSFGKLMDLPYIYEEFFTQLAGGKWPITEAKN